MALSAAEKELLAVVKYYNEQKAKGKVARLILKLNKDFGYSATKDLTSFNKEEIEAFVKAEFERKAINTLKKYTTKPSAFTEARMEAVKPEVVQETASEVVEPLIVLDEESPTHKRLAFDMARKVGTKFHKGDAFYTTKTAMEEFGLGQETVRAALKLLKEKGLIDYRDGNFRNGYVVK